MFNIFIYFIVALLIYITGPTSIEPRFSGTHTFLWFICLAALFWIVTRLRFNKIEKRLSTEQYYVLDHYFNTTMNRQSILALIIFAIDVFGLNLPVYLYKVPLFKAAPTIPAVLSLGVFTAYLAIVWSEAHAAYRRLYSNTLSKRAYIFSNISFVVPILLPWVLLSGVADLINLAPFESVNTFFASNEGQLLYFLFFLVILATFGPLIVQKSWRCTPLEQGYPRKRIEDLCRRASLKYADILYWPIFGGRMITAGVMGLIHRFRYILVTDALLDVLTQDEIDSVIAHEIGHVKKKHLLYYLFFFIGFCIFFLVGNIIISILLLLLYTHTDFFPDRFPYLLEVMNGGDASIGASIFSMAVIVSMFFIYFRYIFGFFMRNFERQADVFIFELFDSAEDLISTFKKIILTSGQSPDRPNWHHFSITERMNFLRKCERDRSWIKRHDRKIRNSIIIYLCGMILFGVMGYQIRFGNAGDAVIENFLARFETRIHEKTNDPALLGELGFLFHERNMYEKSISAYERSIALEPDNAPILNNLAWIYATCEEPEYRNPERAVYLAEKAVDIVKEDYILDTLAESYYAAGRYEDALEAGEQALAHAKKNYRTEFEKKLQKYRRAVNRD